MLNVKKNIIAIITIMAFFLVLNGISAQEIETFYLEKESLNDEVLKGIIDTIYIVEGETPTLYVNGKKICQISGDTNPQVFNFLLDDLEIELIFNKETKSAKFVYTSVSNKSIDGWLYLQTINGVDTIYVYPDISNTDVVYVLQGRKDGDKIVFENLEFVYGNISVSLSAYIDNNNKLVLNNGITEKYIDIDERETSQSVFLETLVYQHKLDTQYLALLERKSFANAKSEMYPHSDISDVVSNEKITLVNSWSGLTYDTCISQFVGYWKRIGFEDYDTNYDETRQVVCQYGEDACKSIRNYDQTFTIFGQDYYVETPYIYTEEVIEKDYDKLQWSSWYLKDEFEKLNTEMVSVQSKELYEYAYMSNWSDYMYSDEEINNSLTVKATKQYRSQTALYNTWSDYIYDESIKQDCDGYNKIYSTKTFYAKSTAVWSDYSPFSDSSNYGCNNSSNCRSISKTYYAYQIGTWSAYSPYQYNINSEELRLCAGNEDCAYDSVTRYASVDATYTGKYGVWQSSCTNSSTYKCQDYFKYTCKYLLSTKTVYSQNTYSVNSRGPCDTNYKISKKENGYRKAYIEFLQPTTYNLSSCRSYSDYTRCFSTTMYAVKYRTWSDYSDYIYTSCTDTSGNTYGQTKRCKATTKYAFSVKRYSDYSDYIYSECTDDDLTKCKSTIKYATADLEWSEYSPWQNEPINASIFTRVQTRYQYQTRDILNKYLDSVVPLDAEVLSKKLYFRYSYPKITTKNKEFVKIKEEFLGIIENVNEKYVETLASKIAMDYSVAEIVKQAGGIIEKSKYDEIVAELVDFNLKKFHIFLNSKIFVPDIIILQHYRATSRNLDVIAKSANERLYSFVAERETFQASALFTDCPYNNSNLRVVYFDKNDPLAKYSEVPVNWGKGEELIDEIKRSSKNKTNISIHLTGEDIIRIRQYVSENGSTGLLKKFKHIFTGGRGS